MMPNNITDLERQLVETEKELDSLKKVYNDLAESHAKQVIEIGELMKERDSIIQEKWDCINDANITIKELESELLKAKERIVELEDENKTLYDHYRLSESRLSKK
ncbi:MAG: hypothetical protein ABUT20_47615 [Bacteroidota bacterium]